MILSHPLADVNVSKYVPAVLTTLPSGNVNVFPLHITGLCDEVTNAVMVTVVVMILSHPLAAFTVSIYVPAVVTTLPSGNT